MTKSDFIFSLLRSALWQTPLNHFDMTPWEYKAVMEDAEKQCVMGLVTDCLRSNNMGLKKPCTIHLVKLQNSLSAENKKINANLHALCQLMKDNGITNIVVKGQTIGALYPKPLLRTVGDIDFYIPAKQFQKAQQLIENAWNVEAKETKEMHVSFKYNDTEFEMHRFLREFPNKKMQKAFNELMDTYPPYPVEVEGQEVPTLMPTMNVFYTFLHLYHHFIKLGVALRQLCDLTMLLHHHRDNIDKELLIKTLDDFGFTKAFRAIGTILICKLGLPQEEFPLPINDTDRKYGEKALQLILKHGNWGRYERSSHDHQSLRYMFERAWFRMSNQLLFLRLSPKYNRSLLFDELPNKTWGKIKNRFSRKRQ